MGDKVKRAVGDGGFVALNFVCPGCGDHHSVKVAGDGNKWGWNGSLSAPTFSPSLLVTSGHYVAGYKGECWCDYKRKNPEFDVFVCYRCHSFIRDGKIQFLSDCTHPLAGQTVELKDIA